MKNQFEKLMNAVSLAEESFQQVIEEREGTFIDATEKFRLSEQGEMHEDLTLQINELLEELQFVWADLEELSAEKNKI